MFEVNKTLHVEKTAEQKKKELENLLNHQSNIGDLYLFHKKYHAVYDCHDGKAIDIKLEVS